MKRTALLVLLSMLALCLQAQTKVATNITANVVTNPTVSELQIANDKLKAENEALKRGNQTRQNSGSASLNEGQETIRFINTKSGISVLISSLTTNKTTIFVFKGNKLTGTNLVNQSLAAVTNLYVKSGFIQSESFGAFKLARYRAQVKTWFSWPVAMQIAAENLVFEDFNYVVRSYLDADRYRSEMYSRLFDLIAPNQLDKLPIVQAWCSRRQVLNFSLYEEWKRLTPEEKAIFRNDEKTFVVVSALIAE